MADPPAHPDTGDDTGADPVRGSTATTPRYPGAPRWVKVSGIVALVVILLVVIMMLVGGGHHGPGRHMPSGGASVGAPPAAHRVQPL